jgi:hypothetical protein
VIRVDSKIPIDVEMDESRIIVRDAADHDRLYVSRVSIARNQNLSESINPVSIMVFLDYKKPPMEFELVIPDIVVNGTRHAVSPLSFHYEDTFPYQFAPWPTNY